MESRPPWPGDAIGAGSSLQRVDAAAYGNDPINWFTAPPTPGTAPPNPVPRIQLRIQTDARDLQPVLLFEATANRAYSFEYQDRFPSASWLPLQSVPMAGSNRVEQLRIPRSQTQRFYRVATPGVP